MLELIVAAAGLMFIGAKMTSMSGSSLVLATQPKMPQPLFQTITNKMGQYN
jgi:hypothetical protein